MIGMIPGLGSSAAAWFCYGHAVQTSKTPERFGKAIRTPARDAMLSHATTEMGRGWGFGLHEAMDQIGALLGPLIVAAVLFRREGYATAFDGGIFGVHAAPAEVQAFYDTELQRQAWQPDTYQVFPTSTDLKVWGWCKPERLFRVAILDPSSFSPTLTQAQSYETLFHATINGRTPAVPCPSH